LGQFKGTTLEAESEQDRVDEFIDSLRMCKTNSNSEKHRKNPLSFGGNFE
jgi:hypothetical protein